MRDLALQHYGIKGMRWGVRRSPEELYRGDKEAFAIIIADANNEMRDASRKLRDVRSGKIKLSSRSKKDLINEEKDVYNNAKKKPRSLCRVCVQKRC